MKMLQKRTRVSAIDFLENCIYLDHKVTVILNSGVGTKLLFEAITKANRCRFGEILSVTLSGINFLGDLDKQTIRITLGPSSFGGVFCNPGELGLELLVYGWLNELH